MGTRGSGFGFAALVLAVVLFGPDLAVEESRAQLFGPRTAPGRAPETLPQADRDQTERPPGAAATKDQLVQEALPFGHKLFTEKSMVEGGQPLDPGYTVSYGDKVSVQIWGALNFQEVLTVDNQGNILIPNVGPIQLAGVPSRDVSDVVRGAVRRLFKSQVQVYTTVQSIHPIAVYVSGFVNAPGRYGGTATDSVLYFLDRAQGIDLKRGSFREIVVMRGKTRIATADLYRFLLDGSVPRVQLRDNDVILVKPRGQVVTATGLIQNEAQFEFRGGHMSGNALLDLVNASPEATHLFIKGTRNAETKSQYVSLAAIPGTRFANGDEITFIRDQKQTSFFVTVEGAFIGQSTFPVQRGTRLSEVLNYIAVDPQVAQLGSIFLTRKRVQEQQQRLHDRNIRQLRETLFKDGPISQGDAEIRAREMQLLENFIRANNLERASGRLIINRNGEFRDTLLEEDDVIIIPRQENVIYIAGEVNAPQAVVYEEGLGIRDYIAIAGGLSGRGRSDQYIVYHPNGEVSREVAALQPGDRILFLPYISTKLFQVAVEAAQVLSTIALAAVAILR